MGRHFSPSKLPLLMAGVGLPFNTSFVGPMRLHIPNGISIGSVVFAGITIVTYRPTDRQTDRQTTLLRLYGNRPHLRSTVMQPKTLIGVYDRQHANTYALLFMATLRSRCGHYIFALWFLSSIFFFIPRLISAAADWMSTILLHMVWP